MNVREIENSGSKDLTLSPATESPRDVKNVANFGCKKCRAASRKSGRGH